MQSKSASERSRLTQNNVPFIISKIKVALTPIYGNVSNVRVPDGVNGITFENEAFPMLLRAHGTCEVSLDLLPVKKPAIPASILRYGSILIEVTFKPKVFRSRPDEEAENMLLVRM